MIKLIIAGKDRHIKCANLGEARRMVAMLDDAYNEGFSIAIDEAKKTIGEIK